MFYNLAGQGCPWYQKFCKGFYERYDAVILKLFVLLLGKLPFFVLENHLLNVLC